MLVNIKTFLGTRLYPELTPSELGFHVSVIYKNLQIRKFSKFFIRNDHLYRLGMVTQNSIFLNTPPVTDIRRLGAAQQTRNARQRNQVKAFIVNKQGLAYSGAGLGKYQIKKIQGKPNDNRMA